LNAFDHDAPTPLEEWNTWPVLATLRFRI